MGSGLAALPPDPDPCTHRSEILALADEKSEGLAVEAGEFGELDHVHTAHS